MSVGAPERETGATAVEQLTLDGGAVAVHPDLEPAVYPDLGPGAGAAPREGAARQSPATGSVWVRWSRLHAGRLGAAGWAAGTLAGLAYVLVPLGLTIDLPLEALAAGWSLGAAAGAVGGALVGGVLGGLLLTLRRWRARR